MAHSVLKPGKSQANWDRLAILDLEQVISPFYDFSFLIREVEVLAQQPTLWGGWGIPGGNQHLELCRVHSKHQRVLSLLTKNAPFHLLPVQRTNVV